MSKPNHSYFNRHEHMGVDTLRGINKLIVRLYEVDGETGNIMNMMFGLFDGFLYFSLLTEAKEVLPNDMYTELEGYVSEIKNYPITQTDTTQH